MAIDVSAIEKSAALAKLSLEQSEKHLLAAQIGDILGYVAIINEIDTSQVAPAEHVAGVVNVFREDIPVETLGASKLAEIAPKFDRGHFVVPRIIDAS